MQTLIGKSLKGFELREQVGAGGTGMVYRAFQHIVERPVAIKVILPKYANKPEFIRRFETEAQTIARLEHPYIVPLYDYWRDPQGAYLVMRWLPGGSLRDLLNSRGAIPADDALKLLEKIASALDAAHKRNVVHRDLKPDNILLDNEDNAYLTDFGIAKFVGAPLTSNAFAGTVAYVAPEQIDGQAPAPQADIYSFGVMIFELLTGKHPFSGASVAELLLRHTHDPLPDVRTVKPDLADGLNDIIQRATAKNPVERYQTSQEMIEDLYAHLRGSSRPSGNTWSGEGSAQNPYKGLRAFQEIDAMDFFGREALVAEMLRRFRAGERFLALVGPSGSGKSSVVRAGLIPALRNETLPSFAKFYIADFVPGNQAIVALAGALESISSVALPDLEEQIRKDEHGLIGIIDNILQKDDGEILLFIDQFEEVFTRISDESERERFLNVLATAVNDGESRLRIIITLRADFYDRPLLYEKFGALVQQHTQVVLPLNSTGIENAVVGPAHRVGLEVDTQVIAAMIADVREEPGALPLLQYALTELFEQSSAEGELKYSVYEQNGGVFGILSNRANELYEELSREEQKLAQQIFLRLVQLGDGTEDTCRRAGRAELHHLSYERDRLDKVLEHFGKARLLTFDIDNSSREPLVELAHEALIRQWSLLRQWLEHSREDLRLHYKLVAAIDEWVVHQSNDGFLLSGGRLAQFAEWAETSDIVLSPAEQDFLARSIEQQRQSEAAEEIRRQHELTLKQESIRRLRYLIVAVVVIAILGIITATSSILAFADASNARATAEANLERAIAAEATAVRSGDVARANLLAHRLPNIALGNPSLAYGLGIALLEDMDKPPATVRYAVNGLFDSTPVIRQFTGHQSRISYVSISPDGKTALSCAVSGEILLWNLETGKIIRHFEGHTDWVRTVVFSPDGKRALSASNDKTMILWDVATGKIIRRYEGHNAFVLGAVFSPDGKRILSGSYDNTLKLWDTETGEVIRTFEGHTSWVWEVAYSPDGKTGLSASNDGRAILWDLETGEQLAVFEESEESFDTVLFSPDGKTALIGSLSGNIFVYDLETYKLINVYHGQNHTIWSMAFSPDGKYFLSGAEDGSVFLWERDLPDAIGRFYEHVMPVNGVAFAPDEKTALSASDDGTLLMWDIAAITEHTLFKGHTGIIDSVSISSDGKYVVSASWDDTLIKWDFATQQPLLHFIGHEANVTGHAYAPDGQTIISGDRDGNVIIWDAETGDILHHEQEHSKSVTGAAYTPDSKMAITSSSDNSLILWDIATGKPIRRFEGHTAGVNNVAITPDGKYAISASKDATLILWDIATGEAIRSFIGHRGEVEGVAISPDGKTAISSSADGRLLLWDIATGGIIREFVGHKRLVDAVAFSPDGSTAISTSADGTLILWEVATGELLRTLNGHTQWASGVAYTPDGKYAVSSSGDLTLRKWTIQLPDEELISWVHEHRVVADLSCRELTSYGVPSKCNS